MQDVVRVTLSGFGSSQLACGPRFWGHLGLAHQIKLALFVISSCTLGPHYLGRARRWPWKASVQRILSQVLI